MHTKPKRWGMAVKVDLAAKDPTNKIEGRQLDPVWLRRYTRRQVARAPRKSKVFLTELPAFSNNKVSFDSA